MPALALLCTAQFMLGGRRPLVVTSPAVGSPLTRKTIGL
jgi:hypothetical protein